MKRRLKVIFALLAVASLLGIVVYPVLRRYLQRASFQQNLKKRVGPQELQTWAMNVLKEYLTHDPQQEYNALTNLHPAFHALFRNPPSGYWYHASAEDTAFIKVVYGGGGFGHFGVEIGPTNRPTPRSM